MCHAQGKATGNSILYSLFPFHVELASSLSSLHQYPGSAPSHFPPVLREALSTQCHSLNSLCHHLRLGVCLGASRSNNLSSSHSALAFQ